MCFLTDKLRSFEDIYAGSFVPMSVNVDHRLPAGLRYPLYLRQILYKFCTRFWGHHRKWNLDPLEIRLQIGENFLSRRFFFRNLRV